DLVVAGYDGGIVSVLLNAGPPLPPLPPLTPPAFSALPTAPGEVTLTITPVNGATAYNIYRSADPVLSEPHLFNPYPVLLPGAPRVTTIAGTTWVDRDLQPLVRYYYAVTAVNAQAESLPTGQQVIATAAPDAPIIGFADPHVHQFSHLGFG